MQARWRSVGLGAARRRLNGPSSIKTRTIMDAIRRISAADPRLGRYFETTIRTGTLCSFTPDPRTPLEWVL